MILFRTFLVISLVFNVSIEAEVLVESTNIMNSNPVKIELNSQNPKVVIFLSATCGCTHSHVKHLEALKSKYVGQVDFFGILSNEEENVSEARKYFEKQKVTFPIIRSIPLSEKLGATHTPMAFVFNKSGNLIYSGGVSDNAELSIAKALYLKIVLESLNRNETPPFSSKKVQGCAI